MIHITFACKNSYRNGSRNILSAYRIIETICKHIVPKDALTGGGVGVGVDEAADCGVVIAGLEVIEPGFFVVVVATIAQGIALRQGVGSGQDLAVGIVRVGRYYLLIAVQDRQNIALEVGDIVVGGTIFRVSGDVP